MSYTITKNGRVLKNDREISQSISNEYYTVRLTKNGKRQKHYVHRLVAEEYLPNPDNFLYVKHKNGDKLDNRLENLFWCATMDDRQYEIPQKVRDLIDEALEKGLTTVEIVKERFGVESYP